MIWEELDKELIFTQLKAKNDIEILKKLGRALWEKGYTAEGYCQAVVDRERQFPTGIETKGMGIAIPHASSEYVKKDQVAIAVLSEPVSFVRMDTEHAIAAVHIVFMLALTETERHLRYLERIVTLIQDEAVLQQLQQAKDAEAVIAIIQKKELEL